MTPQKRRKKNKKKRNRNLNTSTRTQMAASVERRQQSIKQSNSASIVARKQEYAAFHAGPLPHPSILKEYDAIVNNGAERIVVMAEKQSAHRIEIETVVVSNQQKSLMRGQVFGFIIALFTLSLAGFLAFRGHDTVAAVFGGTTVVGLVTSFITGKHYQHKDLRDKQ